MSVSIHGLPGILFHSLNVTWNRLIGGLFFFNLIFFTKGKLSKTICFLYKKVILWFPPFLVRHYKILVKFFNYQHVVTVFESEYVFVEAQGIFHHIRNHTSHSWRYFQTNCWLKQLSQTLMAWYRSTRKNGGNYLNILCSKWASNWFFSQTQKKKLLLTP